MKTNRFLAFIPSVLLVIFLLPQVIYAERLSIKVGAYANAPKIFQDDQGHIAGFWPDLIADIAEKENWQIEYVWGTWSEGLDRLKSGEIAMMPDVAVTESRKAQYTFSQEAVLLSWSRLYVHEDSPCFDSIFNLNNKKIAVLRDSVNYEGPGGIREFVRSFDINCTFVEYESYVDAFSAVKNNLAYGCVANRNFGDKYEKQYDLKQTTLLFQPIVVNFAFPQQSSFTPLLLPTIDKNIKSLKSETDSIYYQLLEKYFETAIAEKKLVVFPVWAKQLMVFLGLVVLVSVVTVIIYRVQLGKSRRKIRQNYAQLLEQERKYRTLLDNQKEAVFLHKLKPEGFSCFSEVNASAVERYGYSRSEFLQISSVDISVPGDVKKHADPSDRRKLLEQGQLIFETTHIKKSGEQFPVEISTTLVELQGEKYLLSTVRDITERKKAEEFQRIKSIQQQTLAELGQEALHGIDLSTLFSKTTLKLAAVLNVDYTKILQKLPDQNELLLIAGVGWQEWLVGRACVPADANSQAGYALTTEQPIVVKDLQTESRFGGSQLLVDHDVVSGLSVIIGSYKDPWGVLGVHSTHSREFTDDDVNFVQSVANLLAEVIKRKQAEARRQELETQLCQKYKMEAVGLMAGGIAHDFNNNLAIILGNVELSQRKISAQDEIAPHLRNAQVAIFRARDLVRQILTYSRRGVQNFQPVNLPLVISETLNLLRATIPTTVEIETDIAHSHAMINADSTQIQEVLINLCNNAVHAMDGQGTLKIGLESLNVEQTEIPVQYGVAPGQFAKLSIQDSGSGMTPEIMEKIFDPFFTTKEVGEGTGMGLAVVHGIIKSHSGFARVNSHPGRGSIFEIYFPVIAAPKLGIIPTIHDLPKGNERILFVDDEEMLTNIWSQMLSDHGYQVTTKTSSTKALEMFKKNPQQFDLVITDQTMPELSGKDLIKKLLSIRPDLPTILCTGYSNKINEEEAEKLGIKAFCMKPLDMVELVQITRKVLHGAKQ